MICFFNGGLWPAWPRSSLWAILVRPQPCLAVQELRDGGCNVKVIYEWLPSAISCPKVRLDFIDIVMEAFLQDNPEYEKKIYWSGQVLDGPNQIHVPNVSQPFK